MSVWSEKTVRQSSLTPQLQASFLSLSLSSKTLAGKENKDGFLSQN